MSEPHPRVLFVPVSGPFGMGEFARSSAIARAVQQRWPAAAVHFVLSREAPYAAGAPFPVTLVPASATFHTGVVADLIRTWRPQVVIFDNAGRTAQLQAAQRHGARVVYISARRRQRRKAFRLGWMRLIDEHWIAYPEFIAGGLTWIERLKHRLLHRPTVRYLDVIFSRTRPTSGDEPGPMACQERGGFVLVVPGGGTGHPGAEDASAQFLSAAQMLAAGGEAVRYVGPAEAGTKAEADSTTPAAEGAEITGAGINGAGITAAEITATEITAAGITAAGITAAGITGTETARTETTRTETTRTEASGSAHVQLLGTLPQTELAELMRRARLVVVNGGSTLLQAIACGAACLAVPIANDQRERIRRCVAAGVAIEAPLAASEIAASAQALLCDEPSRAALAERARGLDLADGVEVALRAIAPYLEPPEGSAPHA